MFTGVPCICNDEENDVWFMIHATHVLGLGEPFHPYKFLVKCNFNKLNCTKSKIEYRGDTYEAAFYLAEGYVFFCVEGRSNRFILDTMCFTGPLSTQPIIEGQSL